ncbi:MBL fold metallo-hydrolase [Bacillus sp. CGMCC 1.16607]|uniref:MBL fold metallo-hydrolase n=1 Tax=Bacillus sp. CGMCC 1.16607 TaxID=3351842 RepID=UPI00362A7F37
MNFLKNYTLEEVSEGIFAAISKNSGGACSNSGIIDLGDQTIIFDTSFTIQAAQELRQIAEQVTKSPITYVINSHWHGDHIRGNMVFKDCSIIASQKTKMKMDETHPSLLKEHKDSIHQYQDHVTNLRKKRELEKGKEEIETLTDSILQMEEIISTLPEVEYISPSHTFNEGLTIKGSLLTAQLISIGQGHTEDDSILFIPERGILFTGDILVKNTHPYMLDGNIFEWLEALKKISEYPCSHWIPGHGIVANKGDLTTLVNYMTETIQLSKQNTDVTLIDIPEPYSRWKGKQAFYSNIEFIRSQLK